MYMNQFYVHWHIEVWYIGIYTICKPMTQKGVPLFYCQGDGYTQSLQAHVRECVCACLADDVIRVIRGWCDSWVGVVFHA